MLRPARYLIAVADHGSFTRAAAELHVSQPAMSQQVKQLEESLGVKLLDRNGAKLKPTDAGRIYICAVRCRASMPRAAPCTTWRTSRKER